MQRGGGPRGSGVGFRERAARREAVVGGGGEGSWGGGGDGGLVTGKRQGDGKGFGYFVENHIEVYY
jgi:hypothetical protein